MAAADALDLFVQGEEVFARIGACDPDGGDAVTCGLVVGAAITGGQAGDDADACSQGGSFAEFVFVGQPVDDQVGETK